MAAQELLKRVGRGEQPDISLSILYPRYRTARHHKIIAEQQERVERGEIDRLMLLVPPRHGEVGTGDQALASLVAGQAAAQAIPVGVAE